MTQNPGELSLGFSNCKLLTVLVRTSESILTSTESDVRIRISIDVNDTCAKVWRADVWSDSRSFLSGWVCCWHGLMSGSAHQSLLRKSRSGRFSGRCYTSCQFSPSPPFCLGLPLFEAYLLYHCIQQSLSTCWQITLCTGSSNWEVDIRCDMSTDALSNCSTHTPANVR